MRSRCIYRFFWITHSPRNEIECTYIVFPVLLINHKEMSGMQEWLKIQEKQIISQKNSSQKLYDCLGQKLSLRILPQKIRYRRYDALEKVCWQAELSKIVYLQAKLACFISTKTRWHNWDGYLEYLFKSAIHVSTSWLIFSSWYLWFYPWD